MNRNKIFKICLIGVEFVIVAVMIILWRFSLNNMHDVETSICDWKSDYAVCGKDGWYVDEQMIRQIDEPIDLLYGPYLSLSKGSYTVEVSYETEADQYCQVYADSGNEYYIKESEALLSNHKNTCSYDVEIKENIDNLEVLVSYNGIGRLAIHDISIHENGNAFTRSIAIVIIFFVFFDLYLVLGEQSQEKRNIILALAGIALLASLPTFIHGMNRGHDLDFHLLRIEGIVQSLREGQFPAYIQSVWLDGYGYPVSIYYGDCLLYIPALFRLAGFSITASYKIFVFLINLATTIVSYFVLKGIFKNKHIALVASLAYVSAAYRLINIYVRSAVGEYSAMLFLLFVVYGIYRIYTDDVQSYRLYMKNALILAIGMSGLIGCHILSTEMVCVFLILVCIVLWRKTFRKETIFVYILAVVETLLLSAYFLVPFFDYMKNVVTNINGGASNDVVHIIQYSGAYIAGYFSFFQNIFGKHSDLVSERMSLTPGLALMTAFILAFVLLIKRNGNKKLLFYFVFSIIGLFIASNLFPWDYLAKHFKIGNMMAQVQFPFRYLEIVIVFLTLLLGELLYIVNRKNRRQFHKLAYLMTAVCCVTVFFVTGSLNDGSKVEDDGSKIVSYYDTPSIYSGFVGSGEYLLYGSSIDELTGQISIENIEEIQETERNGNYMKLYCKTGDKEGIVEVPMFNYKGYHVTDEHGNELEITNGKNNVIRFLIPENFDGTVEVYFQAPWYWSMAVAVSVCTCLLFAILKVWQLIKISRDGGGRI